MNYRITIRRRQQRALEGLSRANYRRVTAAILGLREDPRPSGAIKLTDRPGWRIRVGDYRVVYLIDDVAREVTVIGIGHRSDIYR